MLTNRIAASHGGRDRPPPICKPLWNVAQEITVLYSAFWREIIRPTRVFGGNLSWTAFLTISELRATRKNKTCYQHRKKSKKDFMERHIICWMMALPILNPGKTFCLFYWSFLYVCVNWQVKPYKNKLCLNDALIKKNTIRPCAFLVWLVKGVNDSWSHYNAIRRATDSW